MLHKLNILMIFLDGVGIGKRDSRYNPFFIYQMETFRFLFDKKVPHLNDAYCRSCVSSLVPLNTTLGIKGLPQSGTGQTSLLTGVNASKLLGRHFGPYPHSELKPVLKEKSIFKVLHNSGKKILYANAFPQQFFDHLKSSKPRMTAITYSWFCNGFSVNNSESLLKGQAISSDITNERWHELGYSDMPIISPSDAGRRLGKLTADYDFVLYEYYLTDHVGHSRSVDEAIAILKTLDSMLMSVIDTLDIESTLLIITSDHGNFEDLSTKSHTRNPVPFIAYGLQHRKVSESLRSITHVVPRIMKLLA